MALQNYDTKYELNQLLSGIKNLEIGDSVTEIEGGAFCGCSSLENLSLGDGITSISGEQFSDCTSLKTVTIGRNVETIGWGPFINCKELTDIYVKGRSSAPSTWDSEWARVVVDDGYGCYDKEINIHWNQ